MTAYSSFDCDPEVQHCGFAKPATGPAIEAATKVNEAWTVYKKHKQDNWAPTEKEKKEKKYEQFLADFMNKHGRLPRFSR